MSRRSPIRGVVQLDLTGGEEHIYATRGRMQDPAPDRPARTRMDRHGRMTRREYCMAGGRQDPPSGEPAVMVWFANDGDATAPLVVQQIGHYQGNQRHSPTPDTPGFQRFWPNGRVRETIHYRRGKKHGDTVYYAEQGGELARERYQRGRLVTPPVAPGAAPVERQTDFLALLGEPVLVAKPVRTRAVVPPARSPGLEVAASVVGAVRARPLVTATPRPATPRPVSPSAPAAVRP